MNLKIRIHVLFSDLVLLCELLLVSTGVNRPVALIRLWFFFHVIYLFGFPVTFFPPYLAPKTFCFLCIWLIVCQYAFSTDLLRESLFCYLRGFYYCFSLTLADFNQRVSWSSFTGVWVTASLLTSARLFPVFSLISTMPWSVWIRSFLCQFILSLL